MVGVLLAIALILAAAKLAGHLAIRIGQPAVLGELAVGTVLGNLDLVGFRGLEYLKADHSIGLLSELGVILLLFEVGLTSTLGEMAKVGLAAVTVALLGVLVPFGLGFGASALILRETSVYVHLFIGAALTATSVGITARVLRDLGRADTPEARIILGAAVIDDVLGLLVLAVVAGVIGAAAGGKPLPWQTVASIVAKAAAFLVGAVLLGGFVSPRLFRAAAKLRGGGLLVVSALVICFLFAGTAAAAGLAPIVGAFAAGLVLEPVHYQHLEDREGRDLEDLLAPVTSFLVPIFFVHMGMLVDLPALVRPDVLGLAAVLTVVAIVGKQACALGVRKGLDRLSIGLGMVPRGEVGLIFANIGASLEVGGEPVLREGTFGAIIVVVMLTTLVTPLALRWSLSRRPRQAEA